MEIIAIQGKQRVYLTFMEFIDSMVTSERQLLVMAPIKFGEILMIGKQAEQEGKLVGRPRILYVIFLHPNTEMCILHHIHFDCDKNTLLH